MYLLPLRGKAFTDDPLEKGNRNQRGNIQLGSRRKLTAPARRQAPEARQIVAAGEQSEPRRGGRNQGETLTSLISNV